MKITKIIAALVFGLFLALGSVIGVSAHDRTPATKQNNMKMKHHHHHHKHHKHHHRHRRMMKKT